MTNYDVTILGEHRVLTFAKQQFNHFYAHLEHHYALSQNIIIGTIDQLQASSVEEYTTIANALLEATYSDEFVIQHTTDTLYLIGSTPRAALLAVYHYFEHEFNFKWAIPNTENKTVAKKNIYGLNIQHHSSPVMERRGIVVETIDDIDFMQDLVDWMAKNKLNELFLTFTLYDKISTHINEMLLDRGIELTLGGHSASFFMKQLQTDRTVDHPYTAKKQLEYTDLSWQPSFIEQVVQYCKNISSLTRLSLWPEDIKHQSSANFLKHYIDFTNRLRQAFHAEGLKVEVEHIAYNAGLAWDMLERKDVEIVDSVHTLFAYWGRDYTSDFDNEQNESDSRGNSALVDWKNGTQQKSTKLTVFEYYSDHFMISPLFAMLSNRIEQDIQYYVSLGINGITNLIVPSRVEHYPYQWNQYFNSFIYARALWNEDVKKCVDYYASHVPSPLHSTFKQWLLDCESELAALTKWNVPLFPARAVDVDKVTTVSKEQRKLIIEQMETIISLAKQYLQKSEIACSPNLVDVLNHVLSYAEDVHKQWLIKS